MGEGMSERELNLPPVTELIELVAVCDKCHRLAHSLGDPPPAKEAFKGWLRKPAEENSVRRSKRGGT